MRDRKIEIELWDGYKLVAEQTPDPNYRREICVGIKDKNGVWHQDLAIIRNAYAIDKDLNIIWKENEFEVLVYGDEYDEDFTNKFAIGLYKEEENEVWDQTY